MGAYSSYRTKKVNTKEMRFQDKGEGQFNSLGVQ